MAIWRCFISYLGRVLALDVKGKNLKSQPSTLKPVTLNDFRNFAFLLKIKNEGKFAIGKSDFSTKTTSTKIKTRLCVFCKTTVMDKHKKSMNLKMSS